MKIRPEILLCPNVPLPLHGTTPREIKGVRWWNVTRLKAYESTDYHCAACGVHKTKAKYHKWVEAHELYNYNYKIGRATLEEVVPLCYSCHSYIHSGRLEILLNSGYISAAKYNNIILHGDTILKAANLIKLLPPKEVANWEDWRLILDGKEHKGKFNSREEWRKYYK